MPVLAVGPRKMRHPGAFSEFGKIHGGEITAYVGLPDYLEERVPTREALSTNRVVIIFPGPGLFYANICNFS